MPRLPIDDVLQDVAHALHDARRVVVEAPPGAPLPSRSIDATTVWLLVGVILAMAALGALAWWTFSGSSSDGAPVEPE